MHYCCCYTPLLREGGRGGQLESHSKHVVDNNIRFFATDVDLLTILGFPKRIKEHRPFQRQNIIIIIIMLNAPLFFSLIYMRRIRKPYYIQNLFIRPNELTVLIIYGVDSLIKWSTYHFFLLYSCQLLHLWFKIMILIRPN